MSGFGGKHFLFISISLADSFGIRRVEFRFEDYMYGCKLQVSQVLSLFMSFGQNLYMYVRCAEYTIRCTVIT